MIWLYKMIFQSTITTPLFNCYWPFHSSYGYPQLPPGSINNPLPSTYVTCSFLPIQPLWQEFQGLGDERRFPNSWFSVKYERLAKVRLQIIFHLPKRLLTAEESLTSTPGKRTVNTKCLALWHWNFKLFANHLLFMNFCLTSGVWSCIAMPPSA